MKIEADVLEFDDKPWMVGEVRLYPAISGGCCLCLGTDTPCRFVKGRYWRCDHDRQAMGSYEEGSEDDGG